MMPQTDEGNRELESRQLDPKAVEVIEGVLRADELMQALFQRAFLADIRTQSELVLNELNDEKERKVIKEFLNDREVKEEVRSRFLRDRRVILRAEEIKTQMTPQDLFKDVESEIRRKINNYHHPITPYNAFVDLNIDIGRSFQKRGEHGGDYFQMEHYDKVLPKGEMCRFCRKFVATSGLGSHQDHCEQNSEHNPNINIEFRAEPIVKEEAMDSQEDSSWSDSPSRSKKTKTIKHKKN